MHASHKYIWSWFCDKKITKKLFYFWLISIEIFFNFKWLLYNFITSEWKFKNFQTEMVFLKKPTVSVSNIFLTVLLLVYINHHAEIFLWSRWGPDWESQIRNEIHGLTRAISGCLGFDEAVIGDWSGQTGPWSRCVFYHQSRPCLAISVQAI